MHSDLCDQGVEARILLLAGPPARRTCERMRCMHARRRGRCSAAAYTAP